MSFSALSGCLVGRVLGIGFLAPPPGRFGLGARGLGGRRGLRGRRRLGGLEGLRLGGRGRRLLAGIRLFGRRVHGAFGGHFIRQPPAHALPRLGGESRGVEGPSHGNESGFREQPGLACGEVQPVAGGDELGPEGGCLTVGQARGGEAGLPRGMGACHLLHDRAHEVEVFLGEDTGDVAGLEPPLVRGRELVHRFLRGAAELRKLEVGKERVDDGGPAAGAEGDARVKLFQGIDPEVLLLEGELLTGLLQLGQILGALDQGRARGQGGAREFQGGGEPLLLGLEPLALGDHVLGGDEAGLERLGEADELVGFQRGQRHAVKSSAVLEESVERSTRGEVGEGEVGACLQERGGGELARSDTDAERPDALGGGDVLGRIPDDHHAALLHGGIEELRATPGPMADELHAVLVVTPEAAKGELIVDAHALQFDPCALPHIAGANAHGDVGVVAGLRDGLAHAGVNEVVAVHGLLHLLGEEGEVGGEQLIDGLGTGLDADDAHGLARDGPVGHAGEAERAARIAAAVELFESARDGTPPRATGGDEGAVDVEEKHGRTHGPHLMEGPARSEPRDHGKERVVRDRSGHGEGEPLLERLAHDGGLLQGKALLECLLDLNPSQASERPRDGFADGVAAVLEEGEEGGNGVGAHTQA
ncbi:hypothetical protein STIAU_3475 [Stigmatella aurantiaca DW4/3-1]|uniref:Uncharacterized protein n=1 Tax=Stigmatella aurantiaca (strain DW4/3-1) TaxID=378806 RepID=Q08SZ0_STIAD|nr:hypothetical protein STIAU_3475 [Stigmatella aurantiaca DW4/3-1]